jgi:hypothetical protein
LSVCGADTFKTTQCAPATGCLQAATCPGNASACPAQAPVADGTPCGGGTGVCAAGACMTVAADLSLPPDLMAGPDLTSGSDNDLAMSGDLATSGDLSESSQMVPADLAGGTSTGDLGAGRSSMPRGCGCRVGGASRGGSGWCTLALLAFALRVRRRVPVVVRRRHGPASMRGYPHPPAAR